MVIPDGRSCSGIGVRGEPCLGRASWALFMGVIGVDGPEWFCSRHRRSEVDDDDNWNYALIRSRDVRLTNTGWQIFTDGRWMSEREHNRKQYSKLRQAG